MNPTRIVREALVAGLLLLSAVAANGQPQPRLDARRGGDGRVELAWTAPGFRLETAASLLPPVWTAASADGFLTATNGSDIVATDLRPAEVARFFRLRSVGSTPTDPPVGPSYDIGNPLWTDLYVDAVNGDDENNGRTRSTAVRGILTAFRRLPEGTQTNATRIRLLPGTYFGAYIEDRRGTQEFPIFVEPADGPGTVSFLQTAAGDQGSLQFFQCAHVYLQDLRIAVNGGDGLQFERCHHVLVRRMRISSVRSEGQDETVKVNQSQHVYIEDSDISDAGDNCIDVVGAQWGHIVRCRIHNSGDWGAYLKGGSAYWRVEGNEIWGCGTGGFTAGQGSGLQFMVPPWIHYEAYDIKVVNNLIHDCEGAGLGVNGGYNILMAHNTLVRVGQRSHTVEFVFGARSCDGGATNDCQPLLTLGGWGTTGEGGNFIPNRNVTFVNNLVYNPLGFTNADQFIQFANPAPTPPESNLPANTRADEGLMVRGNVFWNGVPGFNTGLSDDPETACHDGTCTPESVLAGNVFNGAEPRLVNVAAGDFRPAPGSPLLGYAGVAIVDFAWSDAPSVPSVPPGNPSNAVNADFRGTNRIGAAVVGALLP